MDQHVGLGRRLPAPGRRGSGGTLPQFDGRRGPLGIGVERMRPGRKAARMMGDSFKNAMGDDQAADLVGVDAVGVDQPVGATLGSRRLGASGDSRS